MKMSIVAIVELEENKIRVRLPDTADGYAIGVRLAELLGSTKGVALLHRTPPRKAR